jgi:FkbM family methyltransferase
VRSLRRWLRRQESAHPTADDRISAEHVRWAYRILLDREPENARVIEEKIRAWPTTRELRVDFLTSPEFRSKNPDLAWSTEPAVVIKELPGGGRLFVDLSDYVIGLEIAKDRFEPAETTFVRQVVQPGDVVLDIGANIGYFTIVMAAAVGPTGHVYAFEPLPRNAEFVRRSCQESGFLDRVTLLPVAVGREPGRLGLTFARQSLNSGGAYLVPSETEPTDTHEVLEVEVTTLDTLDLRRPVRFIKIDIEGAEPQALAGAARLVHEDRPIILSELHPEQLRNVSGVSPAQFLRDLTQRGYTCRLLGPEGPGEVIDDAPTAGVSSVVFLPEG